MNLLRKLWFLAVLFVFALPAGVVAFVSFKRGAPDRIRSASLLLTLWALGPVGAKLAQYLSMRPDLFGADLISAMRRYQSEARPLSDFQVRQILSDRLGAEERRGFTQTLGSGSLCVVAGLDTAADGRTQVAKFLRPGVAAQMQTFVSLVDASVWGAMALGQPGNVPLDRIWADLRKSLCDQLNLTTECETSATVLRQFALERGVLIPASEPVVGCRDIVLFDRVDRLCPIDQVPAADCSEVLNTLTRAVYKMIFDTGLVHIDLHPGNVQWREESRQVVLLDFGMVARLTMATREDFKLFFSAFVHGQGRDAAGVVLRMADAVPDAINHAAFEARMVDFIARHSAPIAGDFSVTAFVRELLDIQRDFDVVGNSDVVSAMLALIQLETLTLALDPGFQFQAVARDFIGLSRYDFCG